jgi:2-polyprenyl-6-methoxyphenol hydroxylase-like FAD-dependent oxidoreductase
MKRYQEQTEERRHVDMQQQSRKKAIVIGGGIGGICAAIALRRAGIDATVFERAPAIKEIGSAIPLWSNALSALRKLGVADAIERLGAQADIAKISTWRGEILADLSHEQRLLRLGTVSMVVHRAELLDMLLKTLGEEYVQLGADCVGFSQDETCVRAHFADGKQTQGDFLIGADGLHSTIRSAWFPRRKARFEGSTCWRGIAHINRTGLETLAWGKGCQFGISPMTLERAYWFAQKDAPEGEHEEEGKRKGRLLELFHDWHDPIPAVIEATKEEDILRNDVYELPPLRYWTKGRVALLGDAAHAMTPNLGQGGCLAIEDAVVLADCLSAEVDVVHALKLYEKRRIKRAHHVAWFAHNMGQAVEIESSLLSGARDVLIKHVPIGVVLQTLMWILEYEP